MISFIKKLFTFPDHTPKLVMPYYSDFYRDKDIWVDPIGRRTQQLVMLFYYDKDGQQYSLSCHKRGNIHDIQACKTGHGSKFFHNVIDLEDLPEEYAKEFRWAIQEIPNRIAKKKHDHMRKENSMFDDISNVLKSTGR